MKAAVVMAPGQVEVTTVPDPAPRPRDVVVAVGACGICGTDLHILDGEFAPTLPVVPGHEFAGEVVAVGADVTEITIGTQVAVDPSLPRRMGEHYLIYGAGTMGLMNLELAKRAGAAGVDVVDLNPDRLVTAVTLGCSRTATSAEEFDQPRGWEIVIDCTGVVAAIEDGLGRVGKGGTFLQFGVSAEQAVARWSPFKIYNREITIAGSMAVLHSYERAAELFAAGVLNPKVMISDRFPLEDYPTALAQFKAGIGRKIHVIPNP